MVRRQGPRGEFTLEHKMCSVRETSMSPVVFSVLPKCWRFFIIKREMALRGGIACLGVRLI